MPADQPDDAELVRRLRVWADTFEQSGCSPEPPWFPYTCRAAADRIEALTQWRPIATAPCDDTDALVLWRDGRRTVEDLDHDSDPEWWAERGATHWAHLLPTPPSPESKS